MRKLILVPVILVTAFLAFAFLRPSTVAGVIRAVPGLQAVMAWDDSAAGGSDSSGSAAVNSASPLKRGSGQSTEASGGGSSLTADANSASPLNHNIATAGQQNCGRFGNGFHGGKHNFACPNHPFPPPANP